MSSHIDSSGSKEKKSITRRKILIAAGSGGAALTLSGVASADDNSENNPNGNNSGNKSKDLPGLKNDNITTEDIHNKDPEEIFDEEVLEMTDEELDRIVQEKWDEGSGSEQVTISNVDENCIAEELNLDRIPAIDLDLCLVDDNCAIEFTIGVLGQSRTDELRTCPDVVRCRTYSYNLVSELIDIEICFNSSTLEVTLTIEYCNWRPSRGWDCTEKDWSVSF